MKSISEIHEKRKGGIAKFMFIIFSLFLFGLSTIIPYEYINTSKSQNPHEVNSLIQQVKDKKESLNFNNIESWQLISKELLHSFISQEELINFFAKHNITNGEKIEVYLKMLLAKNKTLGGVIICNTCTDIKENFEYVFVEGKNDYEVRISQNEVNELKYLIYKLPKKFDNAIAKINKELTEKYFYLDYDTEYFLKQFNILVNIDNYYIAPYQYFIAGLIWICTIIILFCILNIIQKKLYFNFNPMKQSTKDVFKRLFVAIYSIFSFIVLIIIINTLQDPHTPFGSLMKLFIFTVSASFLYSSFEWITLFINSLINYILKGEWLQERVFNGWIQKKVEYLASIIMSWSTIIFMIVLCCIGLGINYTLSLYNIDGGVLIFLIFCLLTIYGYLFVFLSGAYTIPKFLFLKREQKGTPSKPSEQSEQ